MRRHDLTAPGCYYRLAPVRKIWMMRCTLKNMPTATAVNRGHCRSTDCRLGSKLDDIAKIRAFTNYLPGFNIPMLPRELSGRSVRCAERSASGACLHPHDHCCGRPIEDDIEFFAATIESKAKLVYDDVSDWLENTGSWEPASEGRCCTDSSAAPHLFEPQRVASNPCAGVRRSSDYRFVLGENLKVAGYRGRTTTHCETASSKKR